MKRLRISSVEDDAIISGLVIEILAEFEHEACGTARTELEAIDAAKWQAPDLMIVDAYLRAGSGVFVMNLILRYTDMPHVFVTGGSRRIIPPQAIV